MKRRHAMVWIGAAALPAYGGAAAPPRRVGLILGIASDTSLVPQMRAAFANAMRTHGNVAGRDYNAEWRSAEGQYDRIPALAADLVALRVDVIVAFNARSTLAARHLTSTIPIVFALASDPVGAGLVRDLARPEANVTGFAAGAGAVNVKHLDLLRAAIPNLTRFGVLRNPDNPTNSPALAALEREANRLHIAPLTLLLAKDVAQLESAFDTAVRARLQAMIMFDDGFFLGQREFIARLAIKARLPIIARSREYADSGFLFSYGDRILEEVAKTADYVVKLFKGARPADLPVQQSRGTPMSINRKTASAIGMSLSEEILLRADEVIE